MYTRACYPELWTNCIGTPAVVVFGPAQHLYTDVERAIHVLRLAEANSHCPQRIGPLAHHALLDGIRLVLYASPVLVYCRDGNVDVAEAVVMVCRVFVVYAAFEVEA